MSDPKPVQTVPVRSSRELGKGGEPPSPYLAADRLRANAYLDLARTLTNYRLLAAALLVVDLVLVGAVLWQSGQTRIVPYVVELDGWGNAVAFGPADELADPDRAMLVHTVSRWLWNVRAVTLDPAVQRRLVLDAYSHTDGRAVALLNRWYRENPPFARAESGTVSVQVTSVLALAESESRWQVQWAEVEHSRTGGEREASRWQAVVTVDVDPPERVEEVITNPLGIRVVDFDWTRLPDETPDNGDSP
ncbi:MAG TPA: VirB8/TrbF family protein [Thermoanaerobaculia bacterium]|nr:VirB8/TrbF family protein [Thermoanaerobaculia bacterium]